MNHQIEPSYARQWSVESAPAVPAIPAKTYVQRAKHSVLVKVRPRARRRTAGERVSEHEAIALHIGDAQRAVGAARQQQQRARVGDRGAARNVAHCIVVEVHELGRRVRLQK